MNKAHRIALSPKSHQLSLFRQAAGIKRFAFNWALCEWQAQYRAGGRPSEIALRRQLNAIKDEQFPWMRSVSKNVVQQAIKDVGSAYTRFFKKLGKYPKLKKKGKSVDTFRADAGTAKKNPNAVKINYETKEVMLPRIGWVKLTELPRFEGVIKSASVSRTADR